MALPKYILRLLRPLLVSLALYSLYLAGVQATKSELSAYQQSQTSIRIASAMLDAHLSAAINKFYVLERLWEEQGSDSYRTTVRQLLRDTPLYSDIVLHEKSNNNYLTAAQSGLSPAMVKGLSWHSLSEYGDSFEVSSIYEKTPGHWVFAVRHTNKTPAYALWIEFDLLYLTQHLKQLTPLNHGYLFIVDRDTRRLVYHPQSRKIGQQSINYLAGVEPLINKGQRYGKLEFYHNSQNHISVFDAANDLDWVFVAGTNRADILASSNQYYLTALILFALISTWIAIKYLGVQLNRDLRRLSKTPDLLGFQSQLKHTIKRFCFARGVQLYIYYPCSQTFATLDYQGHRQLIVEAKKLSRQLQSNKVGYYVGKDADHLAQNLRINQRHYRIPLNHKGKLGGILYITCRLPLPGIVIKSIQTFASAELSNHILRDHLKFKDPLTLLDNKVRLRKELDYALIKPDYYLAFVDIDNFRTYNDRFGHAIGDRVLKETGAILRSYFPEPNALSIARISGAEFCVLFNARNDQEAYAQLEALRSSIANQPILLGSHTLHLTVSVGLSKVEEGEQSSIIRADKALIQAKNTGRNQVIMKAA